MYHICSFNVIKSPQNTGPILDNSSPPELGQAHPREADPGPRCGYQALCLGGLDCSLSCLMLGEEPEPASGVHPHPTNSHLWETVWGRIWLSLPVCGLTPGLSPSTVLPLPSQPWNPTSHHPLPMGLTRWDRAETLGGRACSCQNWGRDASIPGILSGKWKLKEPFYTTTHL